MNWCIFSKDTKTNFIIQLNDLVDKYMYSCLSIYVKITFRGQQSECFSGDAGGTN